MLACYEYKGRHVTSCIAAILQSQHIMGTGIAHERSPRLRSGLLLFVGMCIGALCTATMLSQPLRAAAELSAWSAPPPPAAKLQSAPEEVPPALFDAPAIKACPSNWQETLNQEQPRIVYSVLTGQRFHHTRVSAVQQTWARHIGENASIVFYSDTEDASVPSIILEPPANERIYSAGAWRNFPALMHLHDHREALGCFDWVFFSDDDSFVYPRALEQLLSRFRASDPKYLGVYHTAREDLEWKDPRARVAYAHGGAGYILSWELLKRVRPHLEACHEEYTDWAGDLRVAVCLAKHTRVTVDEVRGLHTEPPGHFRWVDAETVRRQHGLSHYATADGGIRPASFHHLMTEQLFDLERAHQVVHADGHGHGDGATGATGGTGTGAGTVWQHDLSPLMFQQLDFACPEMSDGGTRRIAAGTACRYLFGFRVDVLDNKGPAPTPSQAVWSPIFDQGARTRFVNGTRGVAGGVGEGVDGPRFVLAHGVTPAINAQVVSYPFKRDTCELPSGRSPSTADGFHGLVRHKRAVAVVTCGGCPGDDDDATHPTLRASGPGGGQMPAEERPSLRVCEAKLRAPGCDLELHIAIAASSCPAPTKRLFGALRVDSITSAAAATTQPRPREPQPVVRNGQPVRAWLGTHGTAAQRWRPLPAGASTRATAAEGATASMVSTHFALSSTLPVEVSRPVLGSGDAGELRVLASLAVRGSMAEGPAAATTIGPTSPGTFRVDARCRAPSDAQVVLSMRVDGGAYENLTFALRPCAAGV